MRAALHGFSMIAFGILGMILFVRVFVFDWFIYFGATHATQGSSLGPQGVTITTEQFARDFALLAIAAILTIYHWSRLRKHDREQISP